jgi:acyl-CoA thioester hydrolase
VFEHVVNIRWRDIDALGHVNHAIFVTYLEEGRDAFYEAAGVGSHYVVVRIELDLQAEIRQRHGRVTVRIEVERLGTTSLTTRETLLTDRGEVAAQARVVTVRWDAEQRQPLPFTEAQRARLAD